VISFDTNILITAIESGLRGHLAARSLLESWRNNDEVVLCELVLLELYTLLRNPKVCARPLNAAKAASVIQAFRHHPAWRIVDYESHIVEDLWEKAADLPARLRIYDVRLALTLRHHGVTEFATRNLKDFRGLGFDRVWDPLVG